MLPPNIEEQQESGSSKEQRMEKRETIQVEIVDLESDELCFIPISEQGHSKSNAISVELFDEQRDLEFAIKASLRQSATSSPQGFIDLDFYDDDLLMLNSTPENASFKRRKSLTSPSVTEPGESSNSEPSPGPPFVCEICVETKDQKESFRIHGCSHSYCTDCMIKFVASKLQDKITAIRCPVENCSGFLEPHHCRRILPKEMFDRWGDALCEALVLGSERFYCPFKDCSALLIDDGGRHLKESECPLCRRLFCVQCKAPWHSRIECAEFQKLHEGEREREDIMLRDLAQSNKWGRCPTCRFYVERTQGCRYIKCRCGTAFCYDCGSTSMDNHHYCHNCKR